MVLKIITLLLFVLTYEYMYSHAEGTNNNATDQVLVFNGLWGKWGSRQTCEDGHVIKVNLSEVPVMWLFLWLFFIILSGRVWHLFMIMICSSNFKWKDLRVTEKMTLLWTQSAWFASMVKKSAAGRVGRGTGEKVLSAQRDSLQQILGFKIFRIQVTTLQAMTCSSIARKTILFLVCQGFLSQDGASGRVCRAVRKGLSSVASKPELRRYPLLMTQLWMGWGCTVVSLTQKEQLKSTIQLQVHQWQQLWMTPMPSPVQLGRTVVFLKYPVNPHQQLPPTSALLHLFSPALAWKHVWSWCPCSVCLGHMVDSPFNAECQMVTFASASYSTDILEDIISSALWNRTATFSLCYFCSLGVKAAFCSCMFRRADNKFWLMFSLHWWNTQIQILRQCWKHKTKLCLNIYLLTVPKKITCQISSRGACNGLNFLFQNKESSDRILPKHFVVTGWTPAIKAPPPSGVCESDAYVYLLWQQLGNFSGTFLRRKCTHNVACC